MRIENKYKKAIKFFMVMLLTACVFSFLCGCAADGGEKGTVKTTEVVCPWKEDGAKQPTDYTWEEFEALSGEAQIVFQNSFDGAENFEAWMNKAQTTEVEHPWEKDGAKQPSDYTWEEFEALSGEKQIAFQKSFESTDKFEEWLTANEP